MTTPSCALIPSSSPSSLSSYSLLGCALVSELSFSPALGNTLDPLPRISLTAGVSGIMTDQFLAEQHTWTLLRNAQSDDETSWVMLTRDGQIVPIPGEKILHTSRPRVALELTTPRELNIAEPFSLKCDNGIAYITNQRVSFLAGRAVRGKKAKDSDSCGVHPSVLAL